MKNVTAFILGAVAGAGVTFFVSRKIFIEAGKKAGEEAIRARTEEEIASVREAFKALESKSIDLDKLKEEGEKALSEYQGIAPQKKEEEEPYIIKPGDFSAIHEYEIISLLYYAKNQKLVYASGGIVEHPEDLFDQEFLNRFGEYEEDMLYIRDPVELIDYDIEYLNERYRE